MRKHREMDIIMPVGVVGKLRRPSIGTVLLDKKKGQCMQLIQITRAYVEEAEV